MKYNICQIYSESVNDNNCLVFGSYSDAYKYAIDQMKITPSMNAVLIYSDSTHIVIKRKWASYYLPKGIKK